MYIKSRDNSPYIKKRKIEENVVFDSPKKIQKNTPYIFKTENKIDKNILNNEYNDYNNNLSKTSNKQFQTKSRHYFTNRKKEKKSIYSNKEYDKAFQLENIIQNAFSFNFPKDNIKKFRNPDQKKKIEIINPNKYRDNEIIENENESNIDGNFEDIHSKTLSDKNTIILNSEHIQHRKDFFDKMDFNYYSQNNETNNYINQNNISFNNKDIILNNNKKHNLNIKKIIYLTRTQNDNMQKYKEKQLINNDNNEFKNRLLKTEENYEKLEIKKRKLK